LNDLLVFCCLLTLAPASVLPNDTHERAYCSPRIVPTISHLLSVLSCIPQDPLDMFHYSPHTVLNPAAIWRPRTNVLSASFTVCCFTIVVFSSILHDTAGSGTVPSFIPLVVALKEKSLGLDHLFISALWSVYIFYAVLP